MQITKYMPFMSIVIILNVIILIVVALFNAIFDVFDFDRTSTSTLIFRCVLHWFHGPLVPML
jgi:hypothetical protein